MRNVWTLGEYTFNISILDGDNERSNFASSNTVKIENRTYGYTYNLEKETYLPNGNVQINGNFTMNKLKPLETKGVGAIIYLTNSSNSRIDIPSGTRVFINNVEYLVNSIDSLVTITNNLANANNTFNIRMDMSGVTSQKGLPAGIYYLKLNYYLHDNEKIITNKIYESSIPITITNISSYGIKAGINHSELNADKIQILIGRSSRDLTLQYDSGNLIGAYILLKLQRRTGPFEYETVGTATRVENLQTNQILAENLNRNLTNGMYRILFELYDEYDNLCTTDSLNFIETSE